MRRADPYVTFLEDFRSYIIIYSVGAELARDFLDARVPASEGPEARWPEFEQLLNSPRLLGDL